MPDSAKITSISKKRNKSNFFLCFSLRTWPKVKISVESPKRCTPQNHKKNEAKTKSIENWNCENCNHAATGFKSNWITSLNAFFRRFGRSRYINAVCSLIIEAYGKCAQHAQSDQSAHFQEANYAVKVRFNDFSPLCGGRSWYSRSGRFKAWKNSIWAWIFMFSSVIVKQRQRK